MYFKFSYLLHTTCIKLGCQLHHQVPRKEVYIYGKFQPNWKQIFERLFTSVGKWCARIQFLLNFTILMFVLVNTHSYNPQVVECHAINLMACYIVHLWTSIIILERELQKWKFMFYEKVIHTLCCLGLWLWLILIVEILFINCSREGSARKWMVCSTIQSGLQLVINHSSHLCIL
jgi:hypothetical protein